MPASDDDGGFRPDLTRILHRRAALGLAGAAGAGAAAWALLGGRAAAQSGTAADGSVCTVPAAETAGPFPGDGTNARDGATVNVLTEAGVNRSDIRASFAGFPGVAEGASFTLEIALVDVNAGCAPVAGHALYLWHCDAVGDYSLYSNPGVNYLRGMQVSDGAGLIRFQTIFPGCYPGRWPHLHFEVFASAGAAVTGRAARLTSQFALPGADSAALYAADPRYAASIRPLSETSLSRDMIFADNSPDQMAAMMLAVSGDPAGGYAARATVGLAL